MKVILFFLLFQLYQLYNCIMIVIEPKKKFCVNKDIKIGDELKGSYVCTGEKQDMVYITLEGPFSKMYYNNKEYNTYKSNSEFSLHIDYEGNYNLCFENKGKTNSVITFDLFTNEEAGHIINLAKDEQFEEMYKNVTIISYLFEEIEKNLKFYVDRRETHTKLINDIIAIVQNITFYKVLIMVLLCFFQVFLIRKLFSNKKIEGSSSFKEDVAEKNIIRL